MVIVPANDAVPPTVRVDVPVLLVMVLPEAMTKLPTVKPFCRSRMAVLLMVRLLVVAPKVPAPLTVSVPALIVVLPM